MGITPHIPNKTNPTTKDIDRVIKKGGSSIQPNQPNSVKPPLRTIHFCVNQILLNQMDELIRKKIDSGIVESRSRWIQEAIADRIKKEGGLS